MKGKLGMSKWSTKINVRTVSSDPLVKLINIIVAIIEFLCGIRRTGTLSEEQDFLVVNTNTKTLWFFLKSEDLTKIAIRKISAVKVSTQKNWIIFRSTVITVYVAGVTDKVAYEVKTPYAEIKQKAEEWLK